MLFRVSLAVQVAVVAASLVWALPQPPIWANECLYLGLGNLLESPNTGTTDGALVIGRFSGRPYVTAVPGTDRTTLDQIKVCIQDAFVTRTALGEYIQAGAFDNRQDAETVAQFLRSRGHDARVLYLP